MTPEPARRRPRSKAEAGEQTRAALLEAGARLLRERPVGALLSQVTAGEVASRAGRTIGAFYHHWPDQDSFRRDLLRYLFAPEQLPIGDTARLIAELVQGGADLVEVIRVGSRANLDLGVHQPEYSMSMALWALARTDDTVRELLLDRYRRRAESMVPLVAGLLDRFGLQARPPFTVESITVTMTALLEGLVMRAVIEPAVVPVDLPGEDGEPAPDGAGWDLFGAVLMALVPVVAMPARAAGPDARDVVRAVWAEWTAPDRN